MNGDQKHDPFEEGVVANIVLTRLHHFEIAQNLKIECYKKLRISKLFYV